MSRNLAIALLAAALTWTWLQPQAICPQPLPLMEASQ